MREMDTRYPSSDTVFEYFVDHKQRSWATWDSRLPSAFKPSAHLPFFKILVPTVDTIRNKYVIGGLVAVGQHSLLTGNVGVGKTMIAQSVLDSLPDGRGYMVINFSAQTSSNSLQVCSQKRNIRFKL